MTERKQSNKGRNTDDFIMRPTVDICFKNLMENSKVRKGFVAALLGRQPGEIAETRMLPTILIGESPDDKYGILDVHVLLDDGSHMNLEMQVKYFEYWDERVLYYLCSIFTDQLHEGDDYEQLEKCIHVSILDFNHFEDDICYRKIHLRDDETGKIYSDKLELQMLELSKLPSEVKSGEDVIAWMRFFSRKNKEDFAAMAETNEYMEEAYNTLVKLSADEEKRLEYKAREKALRDYNSQMNSAEKRGLKAGEKIGQERGEKIGQERGEKIGQERGEKIGQERGEKIGQERGEKIGQERGEKIGQEQGLKLAKTVFKLHANGRSMEEIAEQCDISIEQVKNILE